MYIFESSSAENMRDVRISFTRLLYGGDEVSTSIQTRFTGRGRREWRGIHDEAELQEGRRQAILRRVEKIITGKGLGGTYNFKVTPSFSLGCFQASIAVLNRRSATDNAGGSLDSYNRSGISESHLKKDLRRVLIND